MDEDVVRRSFGFLYDQEDWLELVADDRKTASIWIDGLRALRGREGEEPETQEDVETLFEYVVCGVCSAWESDGVGSR